MPTMRLIRSVLCVVLALVGMARPTLAQCNWSALGSLTSPRALTVFDDGTGPALYAAGQFGGTPTNNVAKRDGTQWLPIGRMDSVGLFFPAVVLALTVFDDGTGPALYAGGYFTSAGGVAANKVAKWDGALWSSLGSGMDPGLPGYFPVNALTVFDDGTGPALYAGGYFTTAGGVIANNIAKWDGAQWSSLGSGVNSTVFALRGFADVTVPALVGLYAGGEFAAAGGVEANGIAKWDGAEWSPLGSGVAGPPPDASPTVRALAVYADGTGSALYAGGDFVTAGGADAKSIAKWDGTQWSALGRGMSGYQGRAMVIALTVFNDGTGASLYAGGNFLTAGGLTSNSIARWDGTQWSPLGGGMGGGHPFFGPYVYALTGFDDATVSALYGLYAGGWFSSAGGVPAGNIAEWRCTIP
jgi:trimeric autotransporter adhesin